MEKIYITTISFICLNLATVFFYWKDKRAAKKNKWRVSEKLLHLLSLIGGWPGALLAQKWFKHKTKKLSFRIVFWFTVILNISIVIYLIFILPH